MSDFDSDEYEIVISGDSNSDSFLSPLDDDLESYCGVFAWKEEFINNETHIHLLN